MNRDVYAQALDFKRKYKMTVAWRLKKNSKIVEKHLNPEEKILYVFPAQKNENPFDFTSTAVIALTNERILIGRDRLVIGSFLDSITPDMFNDLKIISGIFWGKVYIDTINELVVLTNIDKRALTEIETRISSFMIREKRRYGYGRKK